MPASVPPPEGFTWRELATRLRWALGLRCPNCGGGPVRASWLKRLPGCPVCGIRLDRGESDYFIGAYTLNLIVAEVIVALGVLVVLVASWPNVPWDWIQFGGVPLVLLVPLATYPFSELVWLAFDLIFRPVSAEEMAWHREGSLDARELPQR